MKRLRNDPLKPAFRQEWTPISYVLGFFSAKERKSAFIMIYALFSVVLWAYLPQAPRLLVPNSAGGTSSDDGTYSAEGTYSVAELDPCVENFSFSQRLTHLLQNSQQIWGALVLFGLIPAAIVKLVFREKLSDYGLSLGIFRRTRNLTLMTVPVSIFAMYFAAQSAQYLSVYPYNPWILGGFSSLFAGRMFLAIYFLLYLVCYYLSWEFFFRGFLQLGTESTLGCFNAVLVGTVFSTLAHLGPHPMEETLGAIAGGIIWGFFVYRSRSVAAGWAMHATLGIFMDFFLLYHFLGS